MKLCYKKSKYLIYFLTVSFLFLIPASASSRVKGVDSTNMIYNDAATNANTHNALGNLYFQEGNFVAALKEYEIAYNLAPDFSISSIYLYNIARCYFYAGRINLARNAIEGAIKKDCMNITYYNFLADCIIKQNNVNVETKKYLADETNPYNRILVGLIYLKQGKIIQARTIFDDFVCRNPKMIITQDVKRILYDIKE